MTTHPFHQLETKHITLTVKLTSKNGVPLVANRTVEFMDSERLPGAEKVGVIIVYGSMELTRRKTSIYIAK